MVLTVTCLLVAGLAGMFTVAQWEDANRIATVISALSAVAAVGVGIWAAIPGGRSTTSVHVRCTGAARATGDGTANTGLRGSLRGTSVKVERTGKADASHGTANTGIESS